MSESQENGTLSLRWAMLLGILIPFLGTMFIIALMVLTNNKN